MKLPLPTNIPRRGGADNECDAEQKIAALLRKGVDAMLFAAELNPWCGLCRASAESWTYEVGRTRFRTLAEAALELHESQRAQAETAALLGEPLHLKPPS
jgi:hypothetical protein